MADNLLFSANKSSAWSIIFIKYDVAGFPQIFTAKPSLINRPVKLPS